MKIYVLPDAEICPFWINDEGHIIRQSMFRKSSWMSATDTRGYKPLPGRWLPYIKPEFPARIKNDVRLCTVTLYTGTVLDAAWFIKRPECINTGGGWLPFVSLKEIIWHTPEYKDENQCND